MCHQPLLLGIQSLAAALRELPCKGMRGLIPFYMGFD